MATEPKLEALRTVLIGILGLALSPILFAAMAIAMLMACIPGVPVKRNGTEGSWP
jgi:hypothetical protein